MNPIPNSIRSGPKVAMALGLFLIGWYLMFSPVWTPYFTHELYDRVRVFQLGFLWSIVILILVPGVSAAVTGAWIALSGRVRFLLLAFLGVGALSAAVSDAPQVGALHVGLMAMLVACALFISAALRVSRHTSESILALCITAGAALFVLNFWVTYGLFYLEGKVFSWASPFFQFANVRFFGQYQAYTLLLVTLPLIVFRLNRPWRLFLYFLAANFWSYQWVLNSRALWAGLAMAAFATCLFATKRRLRWLAEQGLLVLFGGLISLWFHVPATNHIPTYNSVIERGSRSVNERIILARSAADLIKESPLLGIGPGQFGIHYSSTRAAHPHNSVLQLLAEYGLLAGFSGILVLGSLLLFALRKLRDSQQNDTELISAVLCAALVMGLSDSMFSGNLTMPHSQVLFFLLAGWIIGRHFAEPFATQTVTTGRVRTALVGTAALAGLVTAVLTVEYLDVIRDMRGVRIPSFWQYGRFSAW